MRPDPPFLPPELDDTVTARQWAARGARGTTRLVFLAPPEL